MAVKIVVDSSSDICEKEAKELGVEMIPMLISFGDEEFYDGVNLLPDDFYKKLQESKDAPKTAQVTPFRFEEVFEREVKAGNDVVAIVLSSKLSGTYESAKAAASKFEGKVFVIDSLNAAGGERVQALYALELAKQGLSAKEIAEKVESRKNDVVITAIIDTLEYLKKGGRVSSAAAFIGGMLSIKTIIQVIDGEVKVVAKAHGQKKAILTLKQRIKDEGGIDFSMPHSISWGGLDSNISTEFGEKNTDLWEGNEIPENHVITSTVGTHVGPGAIGVVFYKKK